MLKMILLILIIPSLLFSYRITGKVFRSDTREAVSAAVVKLKSGTNVITAARTEENGEYSIDADTGEYTLEIISTGFYTESKNIAVKSDISVNLNLTPQSTLSIGEVNVVGEKLRGTESKTTINKNLRDKATTSILGDPVSSMTKMPGVEDSWHG